MRSARIFLGVPGNAEVEQLGRAASLDCPGGFAAGIGSGRGEMVLGRLAARIERLPEPGRRCVVVGWPMGEDGRKVDAGTAVFTEDGELLARARATWIVPR